MSASKPYPIAIVGTGNSIGNHLTAIRNAGERVELLAAVDIDERRVRAVSEKHQIPAWYTDTAEMLAAVRPALVHIVTPPATHLPLILQCLRAGAWVYCEKPLCASLAEFDQIAEAERSSGCYVSTVAQWRFGSAARHVKQLISTGELGRPLVALCQTLWYRDLSYYQVPWRGTWDNEIGGPTVNLGIHLMDLFLWLMGDWAEVRSAIGTLDRPIEVEDVSMALVRFENEALGNITNSVLSPRQESSMRLDFQRGTIEVNALYRYTNANWRFSAVEGADAHLSNWQNIGTDVSGTHDVQLLEILDCMDRQERPSVSGLEARRVLEFVASLYKAALLGQSVARGSITHDDPFYHTMHGSDVPDVGFHVHS